MKKQKTLVGKKVIFLFGAALVIVFVLLFHKEDRLKTMFDMIPPDRISVMYLQLLLNANPNDTALRLELARQYVNVGQQNEAYPVLEPLLNQQGPVATEARLLSLELGLQSYYGKAVGDPAKEQILAELKQKIAVIATEQLPIELLPSVIRHSLSLGQPEIAAKLYQYWAGLDNEHRFERLKEAGHWYIAAGIPMKAAELYHQTYESTDNQEQAKQFALLAINALRAADKGANAQTFAKQYLQRFPNDPPLLDEAIALALANNDPKQAFAWGTTRLSLDPNNPEQIGKQVDLALAAGDLNIAWSLAQQLLRLKPEDVLLHERAAYIAEWSGKPNDALQQWLWLVRHDNKNTGAVNNALRLAKGLYAGENTIEISTMLAKQRALNDAEYNDLINAFNNAGDSPELIQFLKHYIAHYPVKQEVWEALARAQEQAGLLSDAIKTWQQIANKFNHPIQASIRQIELLWQSGKTQAAYDLALSAQEQANPKDNKFWQLVADLSWQLERFDTTLVAYNTLWNTEAGNEIIAERLIQLLKQQTKGQEAIAIATQAYQRFNQPRWLLLAMDTAAQFDLWQDLASLLHTAEANKQQFEPIEMYWLVRAQLASHNRDLTQALADYQQALHVNPNSDTAKSGMLWTLLDQQDYQRLAYFLDRWQQNATTAPALWGVYAVGLSQLGKYEQSLAWFERQTKQNHDDYLWLLSYADTLVKANQVDAALSLRQYVLINLPNKLPKHNKRANATELAKVLQPAYMTLFRTLQGTDFEQQILENFSSKGMKDPIVRELVVASYLSQENFEAARFWLLRAHAARLKTPVGQRLALALADHDQTALADILNHEGDKLTQLDRVEPLKQLNRTDEALTLLDNYLQTSDDIGLAQKGLIQYRNELAIARSSQFDVGFDIKSLGTLSITQSQIRYNDHPTTDSTLRLQARHNYLHSANNELVLPANDEIDLSIEGKYAFTPDYQLQANLGTNLRDQQSLIYGAIDLTSKINRFLDTNIRLGMHEITTETAALRALGAKDKLSLVLSTKPTRQSIFQLDVDGHRYITRQDTFLGDGYRINAILGQTLFGAMPTWQVRLQGSWEKNYLRNNLPDELKTALPSPSATIETIVPKSYGTAGIGTTLRYNLSDSDIPRQPYLLIDSWIGWAVPANVLAYNGRISLGMSFFQADILNLGAFYGNVQGGQANTAYQGIEAQYSLRF